MQIKSMAFINENVYKSSTYCYYSIFESVVDSLALGQCFVRLTGASGKSGGGRAGVGQRGLVDPGEVWPS